MNKVIEQELKGLRDIEFLDKNMNVVDDVSSSDTFYIRTKTGNIKDTYIFTFADYLVKPFSTFDFHEKFNQGRIIPLKVMQGKIERVVGKMYYIKVQGCAIHTNKCSHCLIAGDFGNSICNNCRQAMGIDNITQIKWEGFIPIKSIEKTERL